MKGLSVLPGYLERLKCHLANIKMMLAEKPNPNETPFENQHLLFEQQLVQEAIKVIGGVLKKDIDWDKVIRVLRDATTLLPDQGIAQFLIEATRPLDGVDSTTLVKAEMKHLLAELREHEPKRFKISKASKLPRTIFFNHVGHGFELDDWVPEGLEWLFVECLVEACLERNWDFACRLEFVPSSKARFPSWLVHATVGSERACSTKIEYSVAQAFIQMAERTVHAAK